MENVCPEGTEYQSVTYPMGESLVRNVHVSHSKCIRKSPQWYDPGFGSYIERNNNTVASIVYMIQDGDLNINIYTDVILLLLAEWHAEDCMDAPSTFNIIEYYVIKSQSHDPDTPTYMYALSVEHEDEYYNTIDDEIQSIMRRETWEIISSKSVAYHNVLYGTCSFKCTRKPDRTIRKFKAGYFVRGYDQKRLSPEPLNSYYPVVQWDTVRLMLILQCILGLQSQSIDFTNEFYQADIPSGETLLIGPPRDFNSDGG